MRERIILKIKYQDSVRTMFTAGDTATASKRLFLYGNLKYDAKSHNRTQLLVWIKPFNIRLNRLTYFLGIIHPLNLIITVL